MCHISRWPYAIRSLPFLYKYGNEVGMFGTCTSIRNQFPLALSVLQPICCCFLFLIHSFTCWVCGMCFRTIICSKIHLEFDISISCTRNSYIGIICFIYLAPFLTLSIVIIPTKSIVLRILLTNIQRNYIQIDWKWFHVILIQIFSVFGCSFECCRAFKWHWLLSNSQ